MSYSLHTLTGAIEPELAPQEPRSLWARFALEISLLLGGACLLLVLLALLSYNPGDAAWSTSGVHAPIRNWVGRLGAGMADLARGVDGTGNSGRIPALDDDGFGGRQAL